MSTCRLREAHNQLLEVQGDLRSEVAMHSSKSDGAAQHVATLQDKVTDLQKSCEVQRRGKCTWSWCCSFDVPVPCGDAGISEPC